VKCTGGRYSYTTSYPIHTDMLTHVIKVPSCPLTAPRAPLDSEEAPGMRVARELDMDAEEVEGPYPACDRQQPRIVLCLYT
jgi:hypothetical protein